MLSRLFSYQMVKNCLLSRNTLLHKTIQYCNASVASSQIETIKKTENKIDSNSKNTHIVSFEAVDQPNKTNNEGEIQIKVKPNNRYCLKSFPRKERLPTYIAELRTCDIPTSFTECESILELDELVRYITYVKGEVDLKHISIYASYFNLFVSQNNINMLETYFGNRVLKAEDMTYTTNLYIPSTLHQNMCYLLLSDIPYLRENDKPLELSELCQKLKMKLSDSIEQGNACKEIISHLRSVNSIYLSNQPIQSLIIHILGNNYSDSLRQIMEKQWHKSN